MLKSEHGQGTHSEIIYAECKKEKHKLEAFAK